MTGLCVCLFDRECGKQTTTEACAHEQPLVNQPSIHLCYHPPVTHITHVHRPKSLLVLINPFSGAKRSKLVWEQKARPVFDKARIKYTMVETTHAVRVCLGCVWLSVWCVLISLFGVLECK